MFLDFGSLHQKHRESAGLQLVCVVMDQMVGDRRPPGASILGVEVVYVLRQPSLTGPPTGPEHSDASWCGQCTRWQVVYIQTGSFSRVCSGTSVRSARDVAASFLTRCCGSRIFVHVAAVTLASCRGTSQLNIASQMFLQLWDAEAPCITSCCGRRVPFFSPSSWETRVVGKLASGRA